MSWTEEAKIQHLAQLHEESRYYRRFHHTIFSISIASYTGLMVLQVNFLMDIIKNPVALSEVALLIIKWVIPVLILLILPSLLIYMFINWHFVQGKIRANIYALEKVLGFPQKCLEDEKYKDFGSKNGLKRFCIGKGHIMFIVILMLVVAINITIFSFLSHALG